MSNVEFDDQDNNVLAQKVKNMVANDQTSFLTRLLIKTGLVKTKRQADIVFIITIVILLSVAVFLFWRLVKTPQQYAPYPITTSRLGS